MAESKNNLASVWNMVIPNVKISHGDLQNPQPSFFINALVTLFEAIDIKLENFITPSEDNQLLPLIQLSEAVNALLREIAPNWTTVTVFDFIEPDQMMVAMLLQLLVNYTMFVRQRKEQIVERENEIDNIVKHREEMSSDMDNLNIEFDNQLLNKEEIKKRMIQMEKEIANLKVKNAEPEKLVNGLKTELDIIEEKRETLKSELVNKQTILASHLEEVMKLKACILTESEQQDVINAKESAVQHNREIDDNLKEIKSTLWKKEEDIKTFRTDTQYLTKCEEILKDLKDKYGKIKISHSSNKTTYEDEKELSELKDKISTLENELSHTQSTTGEIREEVEKLKTIVDLEERQYIAQTNDVKKETSNCNEEIKKMAEEMENIKLTTKKYNAESQALKVSLNQDIPAIYDKHIEIHTNRIKKMVDRVKKGEAEYMIRLNKK